jgi:hypothetical protein
MKLNHHLWNKCNHLVLVLKLVQAIKKNLQEVKQQRIKKRKSQRTQRMMLAVVWLMLVLVQAISKIVNINLVKQLQIGDNIQ